MSWAAKYGGQTKKFITTLLERKEHPEQAYRTCAGILRLAATVRPQQMEAACTEAMARNLYSYSCLARLIENAKLQEPVQHENLRGSSYYKEDNNVR